jgi:DNA-binding NarL/FixJ family response regulator
MAGLSRHSWAACARPNVPRATAATLPASAAPYDRLNRDGTTSILTQMSLAALDVLVVDDEALFRRSVGEGLTRRGYAVRTVASVADALLALEARLPAVVLLDANLPDGSAEDVLDALGEAAHVILISGSYDGDRWLSLAGRCGLMLPKPISQAAIARAVEQLAGHAPTPSRLTQFATRHRLSPREQLILEQAVAGASDKEVAFRLGCARGTIATYWQRIFNKTGQRSQRDVLSALLRLDGAVINM